MQAHEKVSQALGVQPLVSEVLSGETPIRVERYFYQARELQTPAFDCSVLGVLLGGSRLRGGVEDKSLRGFLPGTAVLLGAGHACQWEFMGAIDFALFYFLDNQALQYQRLQECEAIDRGFTTFNDPLVNRVALQLVEEVARGSEGKPLFVEQLLGVMLEQLVRVMSGAAGRYIQVDALQLGRLSHLLGWVQHNLHQPMNTAVLAERVGVSESHFRRIFQDAMGLTPHRFIMQLRLKRVREFLVSTTLSIARIASECGFESQSHLTVSFRNAYGVPPARLRRESLCQAVPSVAVGH